MTIALQYLMRHKKNSVDGRTRANLLTQVNVV